MTQSWASRPPRPSPVSPFHLERELRSPQWLAHVAAEFCALRAGVTRVEGRVCVCVCVCVCSKGWSYTCGRACVCVCVCVGQWGESEGLAACGG